MSKLSQEILFLNDSVGRVAAGAKMFFYEAGTTTPKNTYTNSELSSTNSNPVIADGRGIFPDIWLETGAYDIVAQENDGTQIWVSENVNAADAATNSGAAIYYSTLTNLKLGTNVAGVETNPQLGQVIINQGGAITTDGLGGTWEVVPADTGIEDDVNFVNLNNGLQGRRSYNEIYYKTPNPDPAAITAAQNNLNVYDRDDTYQRSELLEICSATFSAGGAVEASVPTKDGAAITGSAIGPGSYQILGVGGGGNKRIRDVQLTANVTGLATPIFANAVYSTSVVGTGFTISVFTYDNTATPTSSGFSIRVVFEKLP